MEPKLFSNRVAPVVHLLAFALLLHLPAAALAQTAPSTRPAEGAAKSPTILVKGFFDALRAGEIDRALAMMGPSSKRKDLRNEVQKMAESIEKGRFDPDVAEEKVDDDVAVVSIHESAKQSRLTPVWVAKIEDDWRILLERPEDFDVSQAQLERFKALKQWFANRSRK